MTELLRSKKVKTRKDHICQGCGKKIEKGSNVQADTLVDGGDIWRLYHCDECWNWWENVCGKCTSLKYGQCIAENYPIGAISECRREMEA